MASNDQTMIPAPGDDDPDRTRIGHDEASGKPVRSIGEFILGRSLGAGAMGEVILAKHAVSGETVALKLITDRYAADAAFVQRFNREIAVLTRLDHPNIARAIAYGVDQGTPYLAMEFIAGPNLGDVLAERGALFETDVLRIAIQVARGLAYAHTEAGLIHRDIKPANILIAQHGDGDREARLMADGDLPKIIDFGLAKSIDAEDERLTLTGIVMGTPSYMSPEQIRCDPQLDFHTDIYALGATMFHLLTGRPPYQGTAPAIVMTGHLTQPVQDPGVLVPSLNPLTRQLVMTAMAKAVKDRFQDHRGLIIACEKALKAIGAGGGTLRLLRKPMVRGAGAGTPPTGSRPPAAEDDSDEFVPMPVDRETRSITRDRHKQPSSGAYRPSSGSARVPADAARHQPSPVTTPGTDPLVAHRPPAAKVPAKTAQPPQPQSQPRTDLGSEALRKVFTDKIEKVKTTARIRRQQQKMEAVSLEIRSGSTTAALPLTVRLAGMAPMLVIGLVLIGLLVVWLLQR
jgi:serine/threonine-protein kinase